MFVVSDTQSQHAEFEREKQKAESVIKHYQDRVKVIQGSIADKQKEVLCTVPAPCLLQLRAVCGVCSWMSQSILCVGG